MQIQLFLKFTNGKMQTSEVSMALPKRKLMGKFTKEASLLGLLGSGTLLGHM